ncbi:MAG: nicotinate phosphoribosyltransferase [Ignavibacteriae bacterium]|nr:nicotinate phosphoribosyltransferase [Ignavibacteriota bacterium]
MAILDKHTALYTDFYQLTMAQGYFLSGKADSRAAFDYFFRENPFEGGYVLFAGLSDVLDALQQFRFGQDDIDYLRSVGLQEPFLKYLSAFQFRGDVSSVREGEAVFPLEPIVRVEGNIIESQVIETLLLNFLNFESLIATKASRIKHAAGNRRVVDFGLRRAQGLGGILASKAAIVGGVEATSNVYSAFQWGLEVTGTQGHSWIQCFDTELAAFRKFAEIFPERCVLLVDTYNTLKSGVPNAITVAKELEQRGNRLLAIRLDSGDLAYLGKHARALLDAAGLQYVKIVVSNQLDEYVIRSLLEQGAPIDVFGVGTHLVTGKNSPALDGVYKLSVYDNKPRLKFSENFTKTTLPGLKKILRFSDNGDKFYADAIVLDDENRVESIVHPFFPEQKSAIERLKSEPLLQTVMKNGKPVNGLVPLKETVAYARERLSKLSPEHRRFEFPHVYKVGISQKLMTLRSQLMEDIQKTIGQGGAK